MSFGGDRRSIPYQSGRSAEMIPRIWNWDLQCSDTRHWSLALLRSLPLPWPSAWLAWLKHLFCLTQSQARIICPVQLRSSLTTSFWCAFWLSSRGEYFMYSADHGRRRAHEGERKVWFGRISVYSYSARPGRCLASIEQKMPNRVSGYSLIQQSSLSNGTGVSRDERGRGQGGRKQRTY